MYNFPRMNIMNAKTYTFENWCYMFTFYLFAFDFGVEIATFQKLEDDENVLLVVEVV